MAGSTQAGVEHAISNKRFSGRGSVAGLLKVIERLRRHDDDAGSQAKAASGPAAASLVIGIVTVIIAAVVHDSTGMAILWTLPAIAFASAAWFFIRFLLARRRDISDEYRAYLEPIIRYLADDIDPRTPVVVRLDLEKPMAKRNLVSKSKPYKKGRYFRCVDKVFGRDVLKLACRLVDGNMLQISCVERVRERTMWKKNARGKIKPRTRVLKKIVSRVRIVADPRRYACGESGDVEVRRERKRPMLTVRMRELTTDPAGFPDFRGTLDAMQRIYRLLVPLRREKKGGR